MKNETIAERIVGKFEDLLAEKGIEIPCEDPEEQKFRKDGGNDAKIYGEEYCRLVDDVLSVLNETERIKRILNALIDMSTKEIVELHNRYCEANSMVDKWICLMKDFNEVNSNDPPYNIATAICLGDFDSYDEYFYFDGYGNLNSFNDAFGETGSKIIFPEDIAGYIARTGNPLENERIREILEQEEQ